MESGAQDHSNEPAQRQLLNFGGNRLVLRISVSEPHLLHHSVMLNLVAMVTVVTLFISDWFTHKESLTAAE